MRDQCKDCFSFDQILALPLLHEFFVLIVMNTGKPAIKNDKTRPAKSSISTGSLEVRVYLQFSDLLFL
jgi:hypothetical protein